MRPRALKVVGATRAVHVADIQANAATAAVQPEDERLPSSPGRIGDGPAGPGASAARRLARRASAALLRLIPFTGVGVVLAYLTAVPVVVLIWSSFKPTGIPTDPGFTFSNYTTIYGSSATYHMLLTSLEFAAGSTTFSLVFSTVIAYLVERTDVFGARTVRTLTVVPLAIPPLLFAIAWVLLASPTIGFINGAIRSVFGGTSGPLDIYTLPGMILVQGMATIPTAFLILVPALRTLSPATEEAALTCGARPFAVLTRVVIPAVRPALLSAGTMLFIIALVVFDIPGVLGLPSHIYVLSSTIYSDANPDFGLPAYGQISALACGFLVILVALSVVYHRQTRQAQKFASISGKGWRPARFELGRWRRPVGIVLLFYVFVSFVLPLVMLIWLSVLPYYSGFSSKLFNKLTFQNYDNVFSNGGTRTAALHSVEIMLVTASIVVAVSIATSWTVIRTRIRARKVLDQLAFLPLAMPSIMIGLALIYVYLTIKFIPIYGTIWIIAAAMITVYIAIGTRITNTALMQLSPELEEAGAANGAGYLQTFRMITFPLIRPALFAIWIWVAARAISELSAALMLQGTNNAVISTVLWNDWSNGYPTTTAALGVCLIAIVFVMVVVWDRTSNRVEDPSRGRG